MSIWPSNRIMAESATPETCAGDLRSTTAPDGEPTEAELAAGEARTQLASARAIDGTTRRRSFLPKR
ncbi:hypothetical protein [Streptomyces sp. NBC_00582]|uniref:hypothetical protein n=1 Tax=Streptomyces sp. NBC_00582 TaxID=2975783 RepID=UPI002E801B36|nr:hypothetical protein [Streptomyces sp. NBC_00582]WUB64451.1 hypothetical protein OG852_30685 [Streptomyces sp. NBC_00582]